MSNEIQLTIEEISEIFPSLEKLAEDATTIDAKTSYAIGKLFKKFKREMKDVQDAHSNLVKRLGAPDKNNDQLIRVLPENNEQYEKERKELFQETVTLTGVKRIDFNTIAPLKNIITPAMWVELDPILINQPGDDDTDQPNKEAQNDPE